jgi:choline dehydrogenase-like flavoprotein
MGTEITRRELLGATFTAAGLATMGLIACSPKGEDSGGDAQKGGEIEWLAEADFVVVGSGTAVAGALLAHHSGNSTIILEKGAYLGGTTLISGSVCWVPNNHVMERLGYGPDVSDEEVLAYMRGCDLSEGSDNERRMDYIKNAKKVFKWMEDNWDVEYDVFPGTCDYYDIPGAMGLGRAIGFIDSKSEAAGGAGMDDVAFSEVWLGMVNNKGLDTQTNTEVTDLIQDENNRVIGVKATQSGREIYIRANKGVLLGTGGFEHNEQMRKAYLYGPLLGIASPQTNTGDGHRVGQGGQGDGSSV